MAVQRAAAAVGRDHERGAGRLDDGRRRPMRVAHPGVHHAARCTARRRRRRAAPTARPAAAPQRETGQPGSLRDEPQPLGDGEQGRAGEQRAMPTEHAEAGPQPARRRAVGVGQRLAGAFHQVAERHAARARRLAAAALDARLHEPHEVAVGGARRATARPASASMRPRGDSASSPVTRNVGQCGRHRPHATHDDSSSSSRRRSRGITPPYGPRITAARQVGASGSPRQNASRRWASGIARRVARVRPAGASAWPPRGAARRSPRSSGRPRNERPYPAAKSSYQRAGQPHSGSVRSIAWSHPGGAGAQQVPVEQHRPGRRHGDVAGVHVAVAHDPVGAAGPAAVTLDRRDAARPRAAWSSSSPTSASRRRSPTTGTTRPAAAGSRSARRRAPARGRRPPSARRPASPARRRRSPSAPTPSAVSSPSTNASGRGRRGHPHPGRAEQLGQRDRRRRIGGRPARPG